MVIILEISVRSFIQMHTHYINDNSLKICYYSIFIYKSLALCSHMSKKTGSPKTFAFLLDRASLVLVSQTPIQIQLKVTKLCFFDISDTFQGCFLSLGLVLNSSQIYLFFLYVYVCFSNVYVCAPHACLCRSSGTGVVDCEPPYECWSSERVSGALNL